MSTLAYASITAQREKTTPAPKGATAGHESSRPPNVSTYIDSMAALSVGLYLVPHYLARKGRLEGADYLRMLLPALAFTAWTMLQRSTAFDAVAPMLDGAIRTLVALVLAVLVAVTATILAKHADNQEAN